MMLTKKRIVIGMFFLVLVLFATQTLGQAGNNPRTYMFAIDANGKVTSGSIWSTPNLLPTTGTSSVAIQTASGVQRSAFYDPFSFVFTEAINFTNGTDGNVTATYTDFSFDPNPKSGIIITSVDPNQADFALTVPSVGRSGQDVFVDLGALQDRCGDGTCQRGYENYFSCAADCPSGSYDDYCDAELDGICDRDCFSQVGTVVDSDCNVPTPGVCDQNSTYCYSDAIFGCVLDSTASPVAIWIENCDVSCSVSGNRASCGEIEVLKVNPACKTNNDCVVNSEQWYCGCSGSCLKEQIGGQCCFQ